MEKFIRNCEKKKILPNPMRLMRFDEDKKKLMVSNSV